MEAYQTLIPELQTVFAKQQISFKFIPPSALHFGASWEWEVRSVKVALEKALGTQSVSEEVLRNVLIEIEGILNSRPSGYVSSDVADLDPITPNLLGRHDDQA